MFKKQLPTAKLQGTPTTEWGFGLRSPIHYPTLAVIPTNSTALILAARTVYDFCTVQDFTNGCYS